MPKLVPALLALVVTLLFAPRAYADVLDEVRARKVLVWGGDQEGGGPYVYPRDDNPDQVTGFEVELAALIARELGVEAKFFQGNWDKLPDLARTGQIDVVLNGYELTPEREAVLEATKPYYVYGLQLLVKKGSPIAGFDALAARKSPKVGVLGGSAAESLVESKLGKGTATSYDGNTDAMREVETGKLDATVQDTPIVAFYAPRFPGLVAAGPVEGEGLYVMFVKKGETRLARAIDAALVSLHASGELEKLYAKYGLWNEQQKKLANHLGPRTPAPAASSSASPQADPSGSEPAPITAAPVRAGERPQGLAVVWSYGGILTEAAAITILLSIVSFPLAVAVGLMVALGRLYGPKWLGRILAVYVEVLRGTPLMLQLYFLFFFLPELGVRLPAFATAIIGLAVNYSAYESEIYRAGLQAIPQGQMEAALSLGMSRTQALRHIIVPQATRIVIPPVVNDFIALFKDTSVCSVVTVVELTKRYSILNMSTQATIELTLMTGLLYLLMSFPLGVLSRRLEAKLGLREVQA
ncbi:MAG: ABC transporter permease subunit [Polyangiaceae bacterium]|nr:ABC transporter permease subunit [Polyangiaceae bacterium]